MSKFIRAAAGVSGNRQPQAAFAQTDLDSLGSYLLLMMLAMSTNSGPPVLTNLGPPSVDGLLVRA
jgi:hypothetical protein